MRGTRLYLIVQTALCVLLVTLLAAGAISICQEGAARKVERPLEWIYTREKVAEKLAPIAPLFLAFLALTAMGLIVGSTQREGVCGETSFPGTVKIDREFLASHSFQPCKVVKRARRGMVLAAVVLIVAGILNDSARDVFYKAVKICTECVGLG